VEHKILNTFLQAMVEIVKIAKSYIISTNDSITIDFGDICLQIMSVLKNDWKHAIPLRDKGNL
jgi:hypothetical protein